MTTNHPKLRALTKRKARTALGLLTARRQPLPRATPSTPPTPTTRAWKRASRPWNANSTPCPTTPRAKTCTTTTDVPTFMRAAGKNVQQLTISGDLRFRYNYDNEDFQYPGGGNQLQRSRYLYRLRLNLNYTFTDNFFIALGVATNGQSDSQNQADHRGLR